MTVEAVPGPVDTCPRCGGARDHGMCPRCLLTLALVDVAADEAAGRLPRVLGRYRLLAEIARGGGGVVYRAWQEDLQREVAVKTLLPGYVLAPEAQERFRREAEAMAQLDHPGILPIHEVGEAAGEPYFAMRLATGGNLAERVPRLRGQYRACAALVAGIGRAVGHAHAHGILHRDLKPSNIVFDGEGNPLVTDFGLARHLERDSSLTGTEAVLGTPHYIAPEMLASDGARATPAADVYALGAILHELLVGKPPLADLSALQVLRRGEACMPRSLRRRDRGIPRALEAICLRCLERQPRDRYPDGNAVAAALEAWLAGRRSRTGALLHPLRDALPSRRRRLALVAGALAAAVLAAGFAYRMQRPPRAIPEPAEAVQRVVVLPDLVRIDAVNTEAARRLSAQLELAPPLRLLPFDAALAAERADALQTDASADAAAGGFIHVAVGVHGGEGGLLLQAYDSLREEALHERPYKSGEEPRVAQELAAALARARNEPPPEGRLSRQGLAELLQASAWVLQGGGAQVRRAIPLLQRVIERDPGQALPRTWLAFAYLNRADDAVWADAAIDEAARAERLDPTLGMATKMLGLAYQRKGWLQRAVARYEHAETLNTLYVEEPLGLMYYELGRLADGWRMYQRLDVYGSDGFFIQVLGAELLLAAGFGERADALLQAAEARAGDPESRRFLAAERAWQAGDFAACGESLAGLPLPARYGLRSVAGLRGACAVGAGDLETALAVAEAYWREVPPERMSSQAPLMLPVAILRMRLGKAEGVTELVAQAHQALQAAIDSGNEYPRIWLSMAAVQYLQGEQESAWASLARAFELGLVLHAGNREEPEFLLFRDEPRFQPFLERSQRQLAAERGRIEGDL